MILPYTIGFEMTGIINGYEEIPDWEYPTGATRKKTIDTSIKIVSKLRARYNHLCSDRQFIDNHCIEIPSPPSNNLDDVLKFYSDVFELFKKSKVTPKSDITIDGGNHIHFGIDDKWKINIFRDFVRRPYIAWVFSEPDDTESCDALYRTEFCSVTAQNSDNLLTASFGYSRAIRKNHRVLTLEYRCVEAPNNIDEFKDQLDFFIAYTNFCKDRELSCKQLYTKDELNAVPAKVCHAKFNILLKELGLEPSRYEKYVKRNLYQRWKLGRKRIT